MTFHTSDTSWDRCQQVSLPGWNLSRVLVSAGGMVPCVGKPAGPDERGQAMEERRQRDLEEAWRRMLEVRIQQQSAHGSDQQGTFWKNPEKTDERRNVD